MKIIKLFTALVIAALTFAACDDTTDNIGGSVTNDVDNIYISSALYNVTTESYVPDSVLSRSNSGLIGKVKDPETGNYITGDYMTVRCRYLVIHQGCQQWKFGGRLLLHSGFL